MNTNLFFKKKWHKLLAVCAMTTMLLSATSAFAASGTLDPAFGANGIVTADLGSDKDSGSDLVLQPDGKILILGYAYLNPNDLFDRTAIISRYNSAGVLDQSFGLNGKMSPDTDTFSGIKIAIQSDGKLIVAGSSNNSFAVIRYNSNGTSLDDTFGSNGVGILPSNPGESRYSLADLAIESDGKIVVVGTQRNQGNFINLVLARFNSDGTPFETDFSGGLVILDHPNFPNSRYNYAQAVAIQSDGKIVMSGGMMDEDAKGQISLVRFNQDSSIDIAAFGSNGKGTATAPVSGFHYHKSSMVLQSDGKIIVVGTSSDGDDLHNDLVVARFNNNGALDTTFGATGIVITDFGANEFGMDVHLQTDGKIVMVGTSTTNGINSLLIARFNKDGSLDNTFGDNGKLIGGLSNGDNSGAGIKIQPDGKIVVVGSKNGDAFLARYLLGTATTTITYRSVAGSDGWILESTEISNVGGTLDKLATTFNVGDDVKDKQYRSILSFNTSTLHDKAIITSVQLNIKKQGVVGTDPFTTHGDLLLDIRDSAFSNNLVLQTIDFAAPASQGAIQDRFSSLTYSWYTVNLSGANLNFINKTGLTQFRILFATDDNDDLGADYLKFFTGNSTSANMPQLIIKYYVP